MSNGSAYIQVTFDNGKDTREIIYMPFVPSRGDFISIDGKVLGRVDDIMWFFKEGEARATVILIMPS